MDRDALAASVLAQIGEPRARVSHLRDGREHHLFRAVLARGECVLKIPRADAIPDPFDPHRTARQRLEAEHIAILLAKGVPVPTDHRLLDTHPPAATMDLIPGTTAEQALERGQLDEAQLVKVCLTLGKALASLHSVRRPDDGGGLPDLEFTESTPRLLHLDYHLGNVLGRLKLGLGFEVTAVVDWTCARWGPPEADFVEMQVSVFVRNPRARDAFVAGYRQASGRAIDLADVERRAAAEIRRRMALDPNEGGELRGYWLDWAERTNG